MAVTYHDANHNVITRFASNPAQGNGSPLNTFAVNAGGSRVSLQVLDHLLVDVERDAGGAGRSSRSAASSCRSRSPRGLVRLAGLDQPRLVRGDDDLRAVAQRRASPARARHAS